LVEIGLSYTREADELIFWLYSDFIASIESMFEKLNLWLLEFLIKISAAIGLVFSISIS
jgi:hypothetical protein